jgi:hypothetical protein
MGESMLKINTCLTCLANVGSKNGLGLTPLHACVRLMARPAASNTIAGSAVQLALAIIPVATSAKWQVQFPSGWQDLPSEVSCKIEAARLRGENVAVYEQCRSNHKDWWDTYQIDFGNMQQRNLRSGRLRGARRIVDEGDEESAPAMLSESNAYESHSTLTLEDLPLEGVWQEPEEDSQNDLDRLMTGESDVPALEDSLGY